MGRKVYSAEIVKEVWDLDKVGARADEIKEKTKVKNPYQVLRTLKKLIEKIEQGKSTKNTKRSYLSVAVSIIEGRKKEKAAQEIKVASPPVDLSPAVGIVDNLGKSADRFEVLTSAISAFEEKVTEYIISEVEAQTEKIREENRIMKEALEKAKMPNLVRSLKKKFNER